MRSFKQTLTTGLALASSVMVASAATCTVNKYDDVASAVSSCSEINFGTFEVPAGEMLDLTGLKSGTKVNFKGTITFGYDENEGDLITITGENLVIDGNGGLFDGDGSRWWDTLGGNGGKDKPKFMRFKKVYDSTVKNLKIKNTPRNSILIKGDNILFDNIKIDNSDGNKESGGDALGHNTDAFDIGNSNGIIIQNSWVSNQDDCMAVNSGTNITFSKNTCIGGHGISIGSVGNRSNNIVKDVTVKGCTIQTNTNGARIKTKSDSPDGSVHNIYYTDNDLVGDFEYGITIRQDYQNSGSTGVTGNNIDIKNVQIDGLTQTGGKCTKNKVKILCGNCSDFKFNNIDLSGSSSSCEGISPLPTGC